MTFISELNSELDKYSLLQHPLYLAWSKGELNLDILKHYACQYFKHVDAFPRYISAIHTKCSDISIRQVLLENLRDEEIGDENHPELWLRFAEALGASRKEVHDAGIEPKTNALIDTFFAKCQENTAMGIGALYAYERQVPDVARSKIEGLTKYYGINSEEAIKFFTVHISADEWHSAETASIIENKLADKQDEVKAGALAIAKSLWNFLDGVMEKCNMHNTCYVA